LALVITQFGLRHMAPADGVLVSVPTATALFWTLSPFAVDFRGWHMLAAAIFAVVGLFFPAAVTLLTYEANQRMGPTVAGAIGGTAPLFAAGAAMLVLGERLAPLAAISMLAVVGGVVTLSWQPNRQPGSWPPQLLLLPLAAAILRGLAQAGIKMGLQIWPSAFAASLIGYSVSVASAAVGGIVWRSRTCPSFTLRGILWFALVGVCNAAAVLSMYTALNIGTVTTVAPTVATYPLFSLLLSALMLPDQRMTARSAIGTVLTVAGVAGLLLGS
jgi:drug/metabolite transporter (DMT)-like permease